MSTKQYINTLVCSDAVRAIKKLEDESIDLVVTSPPYWDAVEYDVTSPESSGDYETYLNNLLEVWKECLRVLRPNGKLAINSPIMPIPKAVIGDQHTRHLKNINNDIEASILRSTAAERYSTFVWQKQTSKLMFGSYPYPGNILEANTVEFINVYVKPGKPPTFSKEVKNANKLEQWEWTDLTQQVWFMYPEDIFRSNDHPAPFPVKLPLRLIKMYTMGATDNFLGETVLDPFCGTGTTCVAAKALKRNFIGIDLSEKYLRLAAERIADTERGDAINLLVGRASYLNTAELDQLLFDCLSKDEGSSTGKEHGSKHKKKRYGRAAGDETKQLDFGLLSDEEIIKHLND